MKTLHLSTIIVLVISTMVTTNVFAQNDTHTPLNDLGDGNPFFMTVKGSFLPGQLVEISGNLVTVDPVQIILDNPQGMMKASKITFSDRYGYFASELKIPVDAEAGNWTIVGTSGIYHKELNFTILGNSDTVTCYAGNLCSKPIVNNTVQYDPKSSISTGMKSPLKQFKSGITATNVKCNSGLWLVTKAEDGFPACVKPDTAQKLIERGWATKGTSLNNSTTLTKILSQVFPTNAALSVGEPSVKGYLISNDGTVLPNKQINVIIDNATFENGISIENILVGKTFTDQDGCFYLADWNQGAVDRFQNDMIEKTPRGAPTDLVSIKAVFTGDSRFQGSSNATKFTYYTIAVPIIRPAISAFLVNGSDIILEKGKSYNFTDYSTWGESLQLHTLSIEMKNLPCGIHERTREIVVDNQTQVTIPIELSVEKTAPVGNFTTYISVNNQALEPINLEIK